MFGSITTYLNAVTRTWHAQDGTLVAQLVSLRDRHATNTQLQVEFPESLVERILDAPIDEILVEHIKVLYYLSRSRKWISLFCLKWHLPELFLNFFTFIFCSEKLYGSIQAPNSLCAKRGKNAAGDERRELVVACDVYGVLGFAIVGAKMWRSWIESHFKAGRNSWKSSRMFDGMLPCLCGWQSVK